MDGQDPITIGEVHRVCLRISEQIQSIDANVQRHETRIAIIEDRADRGARLGGIWGAIGGIVGGFFSGLIGKTS